MAICNKQHRALQGSPSIPTLSTTKAQSIFPVPSPLSLRINGSSGILIYSARLISICATEAEKNSERRPRLPDASPFYYPQTALNNCVSMSDTLKLSVSFWPRASWGEIHRDTWKTNQILANSYRRPFMHMHTYLMNNDTLFIFLFPIFTANQGETNLVARTRHICILSNRAVFKQKCNQVTWYLFVSVKNILEKLGVKCICCALFCFLIFLPRGLGFPGGYTLSVSLMTRNAKHLWRNPKTYGAFGIAVFWQISIPSRVFHHESITASNISAFISKALRSLLLNTPLSLRSAIDLYSYQ